MRTDKGFLLEKICDGSIRLREVESGRPYRLLSTHLEGYSLDAVQPPAYGFSCREEFLEAGLECLPMDHHWLLAILVSSLAEWTWNHQERHGEGEGSTLDQIGHLPIRVPPPFYQHRLTAFVWRILDVETDQPLRLELMASLNDLVFSAYNITSAEFNPLESGLQ